MDGEIVAEGPGRPRSLSTRPQAWRGSGAEERAIIRAVSLDRLPASLLPHGGIGSTRLGWPEPGSQSLLQRKMPGSVPRHPSRNIHAGDPRILHLAR
jgi:hypothetical protein